MLLQGLPAIASPATSLIPSVSARTDGSRAHLAGEPGARRRPRLRTPYASAGHLRASGSCRPRRDRSGSTGALRGAEERRQLVASRSRPTKRRGAQGVGGGLHAAARWMEERRAAASNRARSCPVSPVPPPASLRCTCGAGAAPAFELADGLGVRPVPLASASWVRLAEVRWLRSSFPNVLPVLPSTFAAFRPGPFPQPHGIVTRPTSGDWLRGCCVIVSVVAGSGEG